MDFVKIYSYYGTGSGTFLVYFKTKYQNEPAGEFKEELQEYILQMQPHAGFTTVCWDGLRIEPVLTHLKLIEDLDLDFVV